MKLKGFLILLFGGMFLLSSCIKENNDKGDSIIQYSEKQVGIICEGNYMWNNARFDVYGIDSQRYYANVFETVNKMPLGDVLQSGYYSGNYIWLVVNNSGKILALDRKTMKIVKTRGGLKSPRYILPFGRFVLVSDLQNNAVSVLDSGSLKTIYEFKVLTGNLPSYRSGWTEQIAVWNNEIVTACYDGYLMFISPQKMSSTKIVADTGCQNLVVDSKNRLWALSSVGGLASLVAYNSDRTESKRFNFPLGSTVHRLCFSPLTNQLYFIYKNEVCQLSIDAQDLSEINVVYSEALNCYGLGFDSRTGYLYIADARDYVSNGIMTILNEKKEVIQSYQTGIIPSGFVFF